MTQWPDMPVPDLWAYAAWFLIVICIAVLATGMVFMVDWSLRLRREYRNLPKTVAELREQQMERTIQAKKNVDLLCGVHVFDKYHRHYGIGMNDDDDHHDPWPKEA